MIQFFLSSYLLSFALENMNGDRQPWFEKMHVNDLSYACVHTQNEKKNNINSHTTNITPR